MSLSSVVGKNSSIHTTGDKLQHDKEENQSVEIMELTNLINMDRVSEPAPHFTNPPRLSVSMGTIAGPTPSPPLQAQIHSISPPPPSLTAEELKAIYSAAVQKGSTLNQLQQGAFSTNNVVQPAAQGVAENPGYYYYFYPIKSFLPNAEGNGNAITPAEMKPTTEKPMMQPSSNKGVEPLFMAVTGFMSMALMFIVSVLFVPKLGNIKGDDEPESKEDTNQLAVLGKIVFESMDGKDCTERMACEMGRFVRTLKMGKFFKIMEIVLPPNASRQVGLILRAAVKKEKCNYIDCRLKSSRPPSKKVPWKKSQSAHDLWMKHFEKEKSTKKKTQSGFTKKT